MDIIYIVLNMYISCMSLKMVDVHFDEEDDKFDNTKFDNSEE